MQRKAAEPPDFNTISIGQGLRHMLEYRLDGKFDVFIRKLSLLMCEDIYELGFGH